MDEKRAFTLVPTITASGEVLPMQAIFFGKTTDSCPKPHAKCYDEAQKLNFQLQPSETDMYWSTLKTMQDLVNNIIAPYFDATKKALYKDKPEEEYVLWKIDCWSVHISDDFIA